MSESDDVKGWIFDIKRFAVHDGPGIRTTVFLKGCPLRCIWCHNPESISPKPERVFLPDKCIACGACMEVCPQGAWQVSASGRRVYYPERCDLCGRCVEACYAEALVMYGREVTVEDVMAEVRKDAAFYERSGGGVTLSGGEPLMQADFTAALLRQCKAEGFHTALDTCGHAAWEAVEKALPHVDLVLYDVKYVDPDRHREQTGASNRRILANLRKLSRRGVPVEVRMLIIPTVNDSPDDIEAAADFLAPLENITAVRLLAYHRLAGSKYERLGRENTMPDVGPPGREQLERIAARIASRGLKVIVPETG